jgi:hypothetical protein
VTSENHALPARGRLAWIAVRNRRQDMVARSERRPRLADGLRDVYRRVGIKPTRPGIDEVLYAESGGEIVSAWPLLAILIDRRGLQWAKTITAGDPAACLDRIAEALGLHPDFVRGFTEGYTSTGPHTRGEDMVAGMLGCIDEAAEADPFETGLGYTEGFSAAVAVMCAPSLFLLGAAR